MKSLAVTVFWPCWEWLSHPERRWLFSSYAQSLSTRDSLKCRRLIEYPGTSDPRTSVSERTLLQRIGYRGLVELLAAMRGEEPWELTGDQSTKQRFENSRTGYRIATSVGGAATGEGGDRVVVDDPHRADEAQSEAIRESVLEWWDTTMSTRLNHPQTGAVVIVVQRLHERDLTGHLVEQGGFEHLCLPAEYEPYHPFGWPGDPRTEEGELLWPERFGQTPLEELKRSLGSYGAAGQLQQRPSPAEGGILRRPWWRYYDPDADLPHFDEVLQSWDMAFSDSDGSDYVVGQVWASFRADRYLLHQVRERLEFTETVHAVRRVTDWVRERFPRHGNHRKLVEKKANGPAVISALRTEVPGVVGVDPKGDKVARARAAAPLLEAGNLYLPGAPSADGQGYDRLRTPRWVQGFVEECAGFPNAAHDDQVDAFSQAMTRLGTGAASLPPPSSERTVGITRGIRDMQL